MLFTNAPPRAATTVERHTVPGVPSQPRISPDSIAPLAQLAIFVSPPAETAESPLGVHAPAGRLLRCQLVNTADSADSQVLRSDAIAEVKLFLATFMSGMASGMQETRPTVLGTEFPGTARNAALSGASSVMNRYAQDLADTVRRSCPACASPNGPSIRSGISFRNASLPRHHRDMHLETRLLTGLGQRLDPARGTADRRHGKSGLSAARAAGWRAD